MQKKKNRCWQCRVKVGVVGLACRCGYVFCPRHHHAEDHKCDFNYQERHKELLSSNNKVVKADKVQRL